MSGVWGEVATINRLRGSDSQFSRDRSASTAYVYSPTRGEISCKAVLFPLSPSVRGPRSGCLLFSLTRRSSAPLTASCRTSHSSPLMNEFVCSYLHPLTL